LTNKRTRGTGSIGKQTGSPYLQIRWYDGSGRQHKETTKSTDPSVAEKLLQKRLGQVQLGLLPEKLARYEDMRRLLLNDYRLKENRSLMTLKKDKTQTIWGLKWLDIHFKKVKVTHIRSADMFKFIAWRQKKHKVSNSTINHSLRLLRRMMNLAKRERWLTNPPHVQLLTENSPRQGFVEREDFEIIRENLPPHLRPIVTFLYTTGARLGETKKIWWYYVDLEAKKVTLTGDQTKSKKPRILPLTNELVEILTALPDKSNWLPVFDVTGLRDAWSKAVKAADFPNLVVHDLRRSAVRNMMRAGVQQAVAMKISGHATTHIFQRYNIVDETDLHHAASLIESKSNKK
jgi:integrase